jgi:biotin/methionine sulfoxide reductase
MTVFKTHSSHWGAFSARYENGKLEIRPHPDDPHPSPLLGNLPAIADSPSRIRRPAIRRGWLEGAPGNARDRGADEYVQVSWPQALDLVAKELRRVYGGVAHRRFSAGPMDGLVQAGSIMRKVRFIAS